MSRTVTYTLLDPTGNTTLLVETPVPPEAQPGLALRLMEREPKTEQVGFTAFPADGVRLRMAGGEFCGNASLSAAALCLARQGKENGTVSVSVSGTEEPVTAVMEKQADGSWKGTVTMPRPLSVAREVFPDGQARPVVRFPGIAHVILEEEPDPKAAEALAPLWCGHLHAEALGLMFLDRENRALRPLVYVPAAGTLFWESSCASGTTAVGAFLAAETGGPVSLPLSQPGGTLAITAEPGGTLLLGGTVRILHTAEANID